MKYPSKAETNEPGVTTEPPTHCPTCSSREVTTVSKVVTAATYWRCGKCGDVWNVERRREGSRYADWRRPGR